MNEESRKVTINLTPENIQAVEALSAKLHINKTSVVNQAISLEKYVREAIDQGGKIIIEDKNGKMRELVIR